MAVLKWKTTKGWISLYTQFIKNCLQKDQNLADIPDKDKARENIGLTGDVATHNHDSRYLPIINQKYDDLTNQIKKLNDKIDDQKHNFFTTVNCSLAEFATQPYGWYLWKGTISNVTGTWLIRKSGADSTINYGAYNIEDPRVILSSNDLASWYSPYAYWHA